MGITDEVVSKLRREVAEIDALLGVYGARAAESGEFVRSVRDQMSTLADTLSQNAKPSVEIETASAINALSEGLRAIGDKASNADFGSDLKIRATSLSAFLMSHGLKLYRS